MTKPVVLLVGALDTKGDAVAFLRQRLADLGMGCLVLDVGVPGDDRRADVPSSALATAVGQDRRSLQSMDRFTAMGVMREGLLKVGMQCVATRQIAGVVAVGGSTGATVIAPFLRELPFDLPKVLVTTRVYVSAAEILRGSDIVLVPPVVDVYGVNRVSATVLSRAASCLQAMVVHGSSAYVAAEGGVVLVTTAGITTAGYEPVRAQLSAASVETVEFHANGVGGGVMEHFSHSPWVDAILDFTLLEFSDRVCGGRLPGERPRFSALNPSVPLVVVPGGADVVRILGPDDGRAAPGIVRHNETVWLRRLKPDESAQVGASLGAELSKLPNDVVVVLPRQGLSSVSSPGGPLHDEAADASFAAALRRECGTRVEIREVDGHLSAPAVSTTVVDTVLFKLRNHR